MEKELKMEISNLKSEMYNYFQLKLFGIPVHYLRQSCEQTCKLPDFVQQAPSVQGDVQESTDVL